MGRREMMRILTTFVIVGARAVIREQIRIQKEHQGIQEQIPKDRVVDHEKNANV